MALKTRAMATEKNKGKKKKQVSFTDDLSPFSLLQPSLPPSPFLQPSLQPSSTFTDDLNPFSPLQLHLAVAAPLLIPSPLLPCPAISPPPIPLLLLLPLPLPLPFTLASSFRIISSYISIYT